MWWTPSFVTDSLKKLTKLSKTQQNSWWFIVLISSHIACYSSCIVCVGGSCTHSLSSRNEPGLWSPVTIQATGYLIHDNALRYSWPRYILHWTIFSEQVLKWQNIIFSSVWRLCPYNLSPSKYGFWYVSVDCMPPCILIVPFQYHLMFLVRWLLVLLWNDLNTHLLTYSQEYTKTTTLKFTVNMITNMYITWLHNLLVHSKMKYICLLLPAKSDCANGNIDAESPTCFQVLESWL